MHEKCGAVAIEAYFMALGLHNYCIKYYFAMNRLITILCLTLMLTLTTSCKSSHQVAGNLNPDKVFTMTEEDIARETLLINQMLSGQWKYNGPSVGVNGKNVIAGIAKPLAKSKLKKKLKKAYKTIGLYKMQPSFIFNEDGTCAISVMGAKVKGSYNYNPTTEKLTLKWHGIPLSANLRRDGKKLHMTFEADKLISLITMMGRFSDSSTIKALSTLLDNYQDVMVGFELKK